MKKKILLLLVSLLVILGTSFCFAGDEDFPRVFNTSVQDGNNFVDDEIVE